MYNNLFGCSLYCFKNISVPSFLIFINKVTKKMMKYNVDFFEFPIWKEFNLTQAKNLNKIIYNRIRCYSVHMPKDCTISEINNNNELLEAICELDPKILVIHPEKSPDFWDSVCYLKYKLRNTSILLTIELIPYDNEVLNIFQKIPDSIYITFDIYHCVAAGIKVEDMINKYFNKIRHVHIRDYEGRMFEDYFKMIQGKGYKGKYILECNLLNDACIKNTFTCLKSLPQEGSNFDEE